MLPEYVFNYRMETGRCYFCKLKLVQWADGSITCPDTWGPMPGFQIKDWTDEFKNRLREQHNG